MNAQSIIDFMGNPTHLQVAIFCYCCAILMLLLDLQAIFRKRPLGNFRFEIVFSMLVGTIHFYLAAG